MTIMIIYRSPHLQSACQSMLVTKLQSSGAPLIPQCNNESSCSNDLTLLGVNECESSVDTTFQVTALLPDTACASAPICAVTDVLLDSRSLTAGDDYICSDPSLSNCSEGACRVDISCTINNDVACNSITAQILCTGGEPASCENNIPTPP